MAQSVALVDEEIDFNVGLYILKIHHEWWGKIRGTTEEVVPGFFSNGVAFGTVCNGSRRKFFLRHPEPMRRQTVVSAFQVIRTLVH